MSSPVLNRWLHLERKPDSSYLQLCVKSRNVAAQTLYNCHRCPDDPLPSEEIAEVYHISVAAVQEAIEYGRSNPPEIAEDRKFDDRRIQQRLQERVVKPWMYLDRKPGSVYRQLVVKGRNIRARTLDGMNRSEDTPLTIEEIAAEYELPVDAVIEALAYCASDPPEIRQDWEMEEALMEARGMNEPGYKYNPKPRQLSPEEVAAIVRRFS
jgi:uncharacterized protein (DUF433 family)